MAVIEPGQQVTYTYSTPIPNPNNFIWIGFMRDNRRNPSLTILDRTTDETLFASKPVAEFLAKLFFFKPQKLEFRFTNPNEKVGLFFS